MECEISYDDFDIMMEDAMSRLNIIVDSTPTITAKKTSNVGELIYQKQQTDHADYNTFSRDTLMDFIDEKEGSSYCDCEFDSNCDGNCDCARECNNIHKSHKCVKLTQIYDSSGEIDTIESNGTIGPNGSTTSSLDENNVYKINYDEHYDEPYEYDYNVDDYNDEVYENIEYAYHAEKMDKQTGNFGRV